MILPRLRKIIAYQTGISEDKITESTRYVEDLSCDSLDEVELRMDIEEEFEIDVFDSEVQGLKTVGETVALIERKMSNEGN